MSAMSAAFGGDVELLTHLPPDLLRGHACGQRLLDGAPSQPAEHMILGQHLGACPAELVRHETSKNRDPHRRQRSPGQFAYRAGMVFAQAATGVDSTVLTLASIATVLGALAVLVFAVRNNRRK